MKTPQMQIRRQIVSRARDAYLYSIIYRSPPTYHWFLIQIAPTAMIATTSYHFLERWGISQIEYPTPFLTFLEASNREGGGVARYTEGQDEVYIKDHARPEGPKHLNNIQFHIIALSKPLSDYYTTFLRTNFSTSRQDDISANPYK
jgi:hypothetical protein